MTNDGSHTVEVRQVDAAGNLGTAASLSFTLDTLAPAAPTVVLANDTGSSNSDLITSNGALTVTPAETGGTIQYSTDGGGTWSATAPTYASNGTNDGSHTVEVRQVDAAGNLGTAASLSFTLDTLAPSIAIASTGGLTSNPTQTVSGTVDVADAGSTVTLYDNGSTVVGTATVQSNGSWSTSVTLTGNGTNTLTAQDTDAAGNLGTSNSVVYTLQTNELAVTSFTFKKSGNTDTLTVTATDSNPITPITSVQIWDHYGTAQAFLLGTISSSTDGGTTWILTLLNNQSPANALQNHDTLTAIVYDANNTASATLTVTNLDTSPAGVAGEPINLGLAAASANDGAVVTMTVADVPSGWTVNGGTLLNDGTWTVQTSDPGSLTITSPADFTGTMVFNVTETWTQADGSSATVMVRDNVEAYPVGSPIFALSGNDFLTGSSGKDLFVFAQPIGNDTIYSFDASQDQIDLIGYAGFTSFNDVKNHLTQDANGNAVITLADGQLITLSGVAEASLTSSNFVFDQTPVLNNTGTMTIGDGAVLPLSGTVNNTGTIALDSAGNETHLELIQYRIMLQGGGQVILSDNGENVSPVPFRASR